MSDVAEVAGRCPFCSEDPDRNEYWIRVQNLERSKLCLSLNQTYAGQCLLIYRAGKHATFLDDLCSRDYDLLMKDLRSAISAIRMVFGPDHLNVELLGNVEPHLHFHLIPRYRDDPRWSRPIWTTAICDMPRTHLPESEYQLRVDRLRSALGSAAAAGCPQGS